MWKRANLKANAKVAFKRNYWKCVLVALLLSIATAAGSGSAGSTTSETQNIISGDVYEENIYDEHVYDEHVLEDIGSIKDSLVSFGFDTFSTIVLVIIVLVILLIVFILQFFLFGPLEVGCSNFFKTNAYEKAELDTVTLGFKKSNYMKMASTMFLRNLFIGLWSLLLIIPGIIKAYEYRMIPFILTDCPDMSRQDAFRISKEMMTGNKWKSFVLDLSFFGWTLLAVITCGIAGLLYVKPYMAATDAELFIAIREEYFQHQRG